MKRLSLRIFSAVVVVACVPVRRSIAQDVSILITIEWCRSRARCTRQAGFAGLDSLYRLRGDYGFAHSFSPAIGAAFVDANIRGTPIPPDRRRRGESARCRPAAEPDGLTGSDPPARAPFIVYQFQGHSADGSAVNLYASILGPWMYLRGGTQPPAGSADYFVYHLASTGAKGTVCGSEWGWPVDASDYALLRKSGLGRDRCGDRGSFAIWRRSLCKRCPI